MPEGDIGDKISSALADAKQPPAAHEVLASWHSPPHARDLPEAPSYSFRTVLCCLESA